MNKGFKVFHNIESYFDKVDVPEIPYPHIVNQVYY